MNFAAQIAADMGYLPEATRKAARPKIRAAGQIVADDAKTRASWSTRIPATIKVTISYRLDREGVTVTAGNAGTPHARPYEDVQGKGRFRHPVMPDSKNETRADWTWVTQASRPFLFPAARANEAATTAALRTALDEAGRALGFGG